MVEAAFAIPGDIGLPTGGYAYDRRILAALPGEGVSVRHVALPGSYPSPTEADLETTRAALAALPAGTVLLIDGLAYGAMPEHLIADIRQPIVALCHHPLALEAGIPLAEQARLRRSERDALAHARHVVVTSSSTAAILVQSFSVEVDRISVAEPGTDRAARASGSGSGCALLAVGSLVPRKGYDVLLAALATLPASLPWHLTIAGAVDRSPETTAALRATVSRNGWQQRVTLLGPVDSARLDALYAGADMFVMSSLFEGYGMVLAEAMARGLAIVTTTGGAAAETVPDAAALKVPPGDAAALADAIERMLCKPVLRTRLAEASWQAGQTLPRWEDAARIIAGVLKRAAA